METVDFVGRATPVTVDSVVQKAAKRLIPFLILCYVTAYLDRVNLGFAAVTMNRDLGFSPLLYGWGAGVFFLGYALFEVPSNLILHRVGARRWIARIMISWGIISALMALVFDGTSFLVLRFLLGTAEAGFAPGIILYLTYWFPAAYRARILSAFLFGIPLSSALGAPLSTLILEMMNGIAGLHGWQWLFIVEAIPAVLLGCVTYFYLTDRPAEARWLTDDERNALQNQLDQETANSPAELPDSHWQALRNPQVLALGIAYFGIVISLYGLGYWLPQIVAEFKFSPWLAAGIMAVPYCCGGVAMSLWSRRCDRLGDGYLHTLIAAFLAACGLAAAAYWTAPGPALFTLSIAAIGTLAAIPVFWTLPTAFLSGRGAAAGVALINSIGNLAGFTGPYLVGWIKDSTGNFALALLVLAIGPLCSALFLMWLRPINLRSGLN